ncbi:C1 family peptidase [Spirochaetota bacterium]
MKSKSLFKRIFILLTLCSFITLFIIHRNDLLSKENFNINKVQPKSAKGSQYIGLQPESQDELDSRQWSTTPVVQYTGKLPSSVDLSKYMPPVGSQGRQGSCVAWATTYATKSYHEKRKRGWSYGSNVTYNNGRGQHVFSPAWTYNQINGGQDRGSSIYNAFKLLRDYGAITWSVMPYNQKDYRTQPTYSQKQVAQNYKIKNFSKVRLDDPYYVKVELAKGNPIVPGFKVTTVWRRPQKGVIIDDWSGSVTGGHAMTVIGYDDDKTSSRGHKGAFKIMNSWGKWWGDDGFFWMSYKCFAMLAKYAYVAYDFEGKKKKEEPEIIRKDKKANAPVNVSATRGTYNDRVVVSWSSSENAASYLVERAVGNSKYYDQLAYTSGTRYPDYSVQADYTYKYRIIAISHNKRSRPSSVAEGFALNKSNSLPSKVVGFRGETGGSNYNPKVFLYWDKVPEATKYLVIKYNSNKKSWDTLTKTESTRSTDYRPDKSATNYYYVRAFNNSGPGDWSKMLSFNVTAKSGPPANVTGVKVSNNIYNKIRVTWNNVPGTKYYLIWRWDYSQKKWDRSFKTYSNKLIDSSSKVQSGGAFLYTIKAKNNRGQSKSWSRYTSGRAATSYSVSVRSIPIPAVPKNIITKINEKTGTITIKWKKATSIDKYKIFRKKEGSGKFSLIKSLPGNITYYSEKIPGKPGKIYFYKIRAVNKIGTESKDSKIVSGIINELRPVVMTPFVPGDGMKNFAGTWRATHWEPKKKPLTVVLTISGKGTKFSVKVKYGTKKTKMFTGNYAAKSRYLQSSDFKFELLEAFENDIADVVISRGILTKPRIVLKFARDLPKK